MYFNVYSEGTIGEQVQCKFELNRGLDYVIEEYNAGNPLYPSNDFILVKNKVSDATAKTIVTELSVSKEKSVQQDSVVIINTRNALLDMIIYSYQECATTGGLTTRWNSATSMHIMLIPGSVYNKVKCYIFKQTHLICKMLKLHCSCCRAINNSVL